MSNKPSFTISIDTEGGWGWLYYWQDCIYRDEISSEEDICFELLDLFEQLHIKVSFALVTALFENDIYIGPSLPVDFPLQSLRFQKLGLDDFNQHNLISHTHTHLYWFHKDVTTKNYIDDVEISFRKLRGHIDGRGIVWPKNIVPSPDLVSQMNIDYYRNVSGAETFFLFRVSKLHSLLLSRLYLILKGLQLIFSAVLFRRSIHIWFHPHDLAFDHKFSIKSLNMFLRAMRVLSKYSIIENKTIYEKSMDR